ncbi:MAG: hypothetical protein JSW65_01790, partial [Candidatus Bipolaricaulota bacterium]
MIDWKAHYAAELEGPAAWLAIAGRLRRARPDADLVRELEAGAILSFPHTFLRAAAPLQMPVLVALRAAGIRRVVALGVIHGAFLNPSYRERFAAAAGEPPEHAETAYAELCGGWLPCVAEHPTPHGEIALWQPQEIVAEGIRRAPAGLLDDEYSLDTFLTLARLQADAHDEPPLEICPVYVGPTRHPLTGSFSVAAAMAEAVRTVLGSETAVVATGDLVHYGWEVYEQHDRSLDGLSPDGIEEHFRGLTAETLATALREGGLQEAFARSVRDLANDQRYILPVI